MLCSFAISLQIYIIIFLLAKYRFNKPKHLYFNNFPFLLLEKTEISPLAPKNVWIVRNDKCFISNNEQLFFCHIESPKGCDISVSLVYRWLNYLF